MSDPGGTITLELIGRMMTEMRAEVRELRDMRPVLLGLVDQVRRIERNQSELKQDIELMIRAELMGQTTRLERVLEGRLDRIEARVDTLEGKPSPFRGPTRNDLG